MKLSDAGVFMVESFATPVMPFTVTVSDLPWSSPATFSADALLARFCDGAVPDTVRITALVPSIDAAERCQRVVPCVGRRRGGHRAIEQDPIGVLRDRVGIHHAGRLGVDDVV